MTKEVDLAILDLYKTFAIYPFKSSMEACPCCVSNSDKEKIHKTELKELDEDDLSRYAFKAISTWGDVEDFKHYLPRIFELLATTNFIVDTFVVLGKLDYGNWQTWNAKEQESIRNFLMAWWHDSISTKSHFDIDGFIEIHNLVDDINELLDRWVIDFNNCSFSNYVDLIHNYAYDLMDRRNHFKNLSQEDLSKLLSWIKTNADKLESGFFYFDQTDKELAEKISNALYIYERTLQNLTS